MLGGTAGSSLSSTSPFTNVQANLYWSATTPNPGLTDSLAWYFDFYNGFQNLGIENDTGVYAWAVHVGDVGAPTGVPEPGATSLVLMGFALVGFAARRRLACR